MSTEKRYPSLKQSIFLLLIIVLFQFAAGILFGFFEDFLGIDEGNLLGYIILFWFFPLVSLGLPIFYALRRMQGNPKDLLAGSRLPARVYAVVFFMFVGLVPVLTEVETLVSRFFPRAEYWERLLEMIMGPNIVLALVAVGVIAPVLEETLFRGIILRGFLSRYSVGKSLVISAFLFGLIHFNPWQAFPAFISGLFLGWIYYVSSSLLAAMFAHGVYNSLVVVIFYFTSIPGLSDFTTRLQPRWVPLVGMIVVAASVLLFERWMGVRTFGGSG